MLDQTRAQMDRVFGKLPEEHRDQIESMFENMEIAWQQMCEEMEERGAGHSPALELHMHELCEKVLHDAVLDALQGNDSVRAVMAGLTMAFFFGYNIGERGWKMEHIPCEEVHSR